MAGPGSHHCSVLTPNPTLVSLQNLYCRFNPGNNRRGLETNLRANSRGEWALGEAAGRQVVRETGPGSGEAEEEGGLGARGPGCHAASRCWDTFPPIPHPLFCLYYTVSLSITDGNGIGLKGFPLPTVFLVVY